jgi:cell division initiation protein
MAELSPLDILGKTFAVRLKGYPPQEVHDFLSQAASAMEALLRERAELKQRVHRLEHELAQFQEREGALKEALVAAQRSAESTLEAARVEAQQILEEGHILADRLVDEANQRRKNLESAISDLRARRRQVRGDLMALAEILQGFIADDQRSEKEEPVTGQLALISRRQERAAKGQS